MRSWYVKKPEILDEFDLHRHAVIEASAGTGKTYTLEHLALEMLITERAEPEELLLVTFTEKAAAEIKARVRKRITTVLDPYADASIERPPESGAFWEITPDVATHLRHVLSAFDQCQISTIHAFCSQLLRTMPIATNAREGLKVVSDDDIFETALLDCLRRRFTTDPQVRPIFEMALDYFGGFEQLKTFLKQTNRLTSERIEQARQGAPDYIAAVLREFRSVPWTELRETVADTRYVKKHADALGALETLADKLPSDKRAAFRVILKSAFFDLLGLLTKGADNKVGDDYAKMPPLIEQTVSHMREWPSGFRIPLPIFLGTLVPVLREALRETREDRAWTDFNEMISEVARAIKSTPAGGGTAPLLRELRERFRFVLVDEFQDTSTDQWDIFHALVNTGSGGNDDNNCDIDDRDNTPHQGASTDKPAGVPTLIVVGDPKQAIYAFRDADVLTYLEAREVLINHFGAQQKRLSHNFRSHPALIEAYNSLFQNPARPLLSSTSIRYEDAVQAGLDEAESPRIDGPKFESGERNFINVLDIDYSPELAKAGPTRRGAVRFMAREIKELLDGSHTLFDGEHTTPLRPRDIMFLGERGKDLLRMARELRHLGVPHAFYKQGGIYDTEEAADFYHLLKALSNPGWNAVFARALLTPFFDLTPTSALQFVETDERTTARTRLLRWSNLADEGRFAILFYEALYGSGLAARLPLASDDHRAWINYVHIAEELQALLVENQLSMAELSDWLGDRIKSGSDEDLQASDSNQRLNPAEDAVQLLTLHKAKGLEAPIVFLTGRYDISKRTPLVRDWELYRFEHEGIVEHRFGVELEGDARTAAEAAIHEEKERLGYVAATRPQAALYLAQSWAQADGEEGEEAEPQLYGGSPPRQDGAGALSHGTFTLARDTPGFAWIACDGYKPPRRPSRPPEEFFNNLPLPDQSELIRATETRTDRQSKRNEHIFHSYSSLKNKKEMTGYADDESERNAGIDLDSLRAASKDRLPPGAQTGSCLHEMLEQIDEVELRNFDTAESFIASDFGDDVVEKNLAQFGLDERFHDTSKEIIWWAYMRPLKRDFDGHHTLDLDRGLAWTKNKPEVEFLFPTDSLSFEARKALLEPATDAQPLDAEPRQLTLGEVAPPPGRAQANRPTPSGFRIADDYLFGFIDIVFQHDGRFYVLDWKTDNIGVYTQDSMRTHVEEYYGVQARMYSIAMLQILGISLDDEAAYTERFGGFVYSFLRGIHEDDAVYANRYSLEELRNFTRTIDSKAAERRAYPTPQTWRQIQ